jgi:hypothetical protein
LSACYSVYGLKVASDIALPGLATNESDVQPETLRIHLKANFAFPAPFEWPPNLHYISDKSTPRAQRTLQVTLLGGREYLGLLYQDGVRFAVEHQGREIWADWPENYTLEDACTYLLGPVMGFVLRLRGVTALHASAVALDNFAIALAGCAGAGKSTTAAAFALEGFQVISDDVVAIAEDAERFLVEAGYPRVNLWPDSVRVLFGSEDALPRITSTWDKRYMLLQNGLNFTSAPLPLRAIYILDVRETSRTVPVIEEIAGTEALVALVANTYVNYLLDRRMRCQEFDMLGRIVARVPIRLVRPTADPSGLTRLCELIAADAKEKGLPQVSEAIAAARHD